MATIISSHIWLDDRGVAWIDDTNIKVIELAMDYRTGLTNPADVVREYGGLTEAQVHSAFAHYLDHQAELDVEIEKRAAEYERLRTKTLDSPGRRRQTDRRADRRSRRSAVPHTRRATPAAHR